MEEVHAEMIGVAVSPPSRRRSSRRAASATIANASHAACS
jgi:hypothetical protein